MRVLKSENINYLHLIPFANFSLWDTKRYTSQQLSSSFPIVKLGDCIIEQNKKYKIFEEEDKEFGILGVNNKEGIFDAYKQKGKEINQPYKKMETGWLAYNPYRINVGSIGIKLKEHHHDYISPAYVVFSCKNNLLPEFLFLLFKTDTFNKVINESTTGSVRQNLTFETLKNLEIPLPSIEEQNKIVAAYQEKVQLAEQQAKQANELEAEIERYLMEELGVERNENEQNKKGIKLFSFSSIDRWDVWVNKNINKSNKFKSTTLSEVVISKPFYGANVKGVKKKSETRYIRITDINETGDLNDDFVSPEFVEEKYLLKENDFLIARSGNTVGKTYLHKEVYGRCIFAGYLVKYTIDYSKILPEYLLFFTKSHTFKKWIEANQRVSGQPNINGQEFLNSPLFLPPLDMQQKIIQNVSSLKNNIKKLTILSENLKTEAINEFENVIFS